MHIKSRTSSAQHTVLDLNEYVSQEETKLHSLHSQVDDIIDLGASTLNKVREQRDKLKGVHSKISEIFNQMGMSNTVMRLIEKRAFKDKFILFGLMILFTFFMFFTYIYFKKM